MSKKNETFPSVIRCSILLIGIVLTALASPAQYALRVHYIDKDSSFHLQSFMLQTNFSGQMACAAYIKELPANLRAVGYVAASIDTALYDSSFASISLYIGNREKWIALRTNGIDKKALEESGFVDKNFINKPVDIDLVRNIEQRLLRYYEENGCPFASISLDSIVLDEKGATALLKVDKGREYRIDSIRLFGNAKISNGFLQRYLDIPNGSLYNIEKLEQVEKLLLQLPYVQEVKKSDMTMLGTGSILNVYLIPKRSSQVDFLLGFAPSDGVTNKLLITGQANLNLKNSLGAGETILLNWQQLQQSSPRLNLGYQQPYIFKSSFGLDFSFNLFKQDSSYLQLNTQLGVQYLLSANQSGKIFLQDQSTTLLSAAIDTSYIIASKTLPAAVDASAVSVGLRYDWNNTNYKFNPRTGNEFGMEASVGVKHIKKNNTILAITDNNFNYASLYDSLKLRSYQFRLLFSGAHYFPVGKQSTLKAAANVGIYSSESIFMNDLFRIGGYKLMRGFDEESIYASQYAVGTIEYHYLIGTNSYLFSFLDMGWAKEAYQDVNVDARFTGVGIGMEFETKIGLLNISYAIGKRSDQPFNLTEASKIHFGYLNYF